MVRSYLLLVLAVQVAGCASGQLYDPVPFQLEAIDLAKPVFGAPYDWEVPSVGVKYRSELNCNFGSGVRLPSGTGQGWLYSGKCVDGTSREPSFADGPAWIDIGPAVSWAGSALCHEIGHSSLFMRGRDGDAGHIGPVFAAGGPVEQCQALLERWEVATGALPPIAERDM